MTKIYRQITIVFLFPCLLNQLSLAQELPITRNMTQALHQKTRSKSGKPGQNYWQNSANYTIKVKFNPLNREIKGSVTIDYSNNSPDTLSTLVLKLYPNLYQGNAMRNTAISTADLSQGVQISSTLFQGKTLDSNSRIISGTNLYLKGCQVLPGQQAQLQLNYTYTLNKGSFIRTGQVDTGAFFIAYFFPRLAVYDDIDGWNVYPYAGKEEFYNDYGNFSAEITVPGNYQVWATGALHNPKDVYQPKYAQRIAQAEKEDTVTDIITANDLKNGPITANHQYNTWKFEAEKVTDFAFAISNHYVWKATSVLVDSVNKRRSRVDAVFNPEHQVYSPVVTYAGKTVALMSHHFPKIPFPYSHITIFDGLDAMEYPMMINNLPFQAPKDIIQFTAHEVFHTLFPFYVGTNETKYSFMDEGWATLAEFMFHPLIDPTVPLHYDISDLNNAAGTDEDMPIITPTPQLYGKARYADKDLKPALALFYLQEMLGNQLFTKATQQYIKSWAGKHPSPYDFFNSMNSGSCHQLNWFWKNCFFEKNIPDLAIAKVIRKQLDYTVVISSPGTLAVPIHLRIIYPDGSTQNISRNISCWQLGNKTVQLHIKTKKPIKQLILGNAYDADIHPENNSWPHQ